MRIRDVQTTLLRDPGAVLVRDGTTPPLPAGAAGRSQLFVHVLVDDGPDGLGIGQASPGVREVIEVGLQPVLLGREAAATDAAWEAMCSTVRDYGRGGVAFQAISAVDLALWDAKAKAQGVPLYRLLGAARESVPAYASGGWTSLDLERLLEEMRGFAAAGFQAVKMKIGTDFGRAEAEDVARVTAVREALGTGIELHVDANGAYRPEQAIRLAAVFGDLGVGFFEEPVDAEDLEGLAAVRARSPIPIATGEHEYTLAGFRRLVAGGCADILQPDLLRAGGVTGWLRVAELADARSIPIASHAAQLPSVHVGCATATFLAAEHLDIQHELDLRWYREIPEPRDGTLSPLPARAGLGLELEPSAVERWAVARVGEGARREG